jgi:hypothetical protein
MVVDARVADRLQGSTRSLAGMIVDPNLRAQQGGAPLAASLAREANVLAYNDVFRFVWKLALGNALLIAFLTLASTIRPVRRREFA